MKAAGIHLAISFLVALLSGVLVLGLWFPYPFREISGGRELLFLVVGVDVVCGPLLTLVLYSPAKPRSELIRDLSLVGALQIAALMFGIFSAWEARPVALAFEVDRFRAVSFADLDPGDRISPAMRAEIQAARPGIAAVGVRSPRNADEQFDSIKLSLNGLEPGQRPSWWRPYSLDVKRALAAARPIDELLAKHPDSRKAVDEAIGKSGTDASALLWLPVVSRKASDWVVLIDSSTGQVRAFAQLDGF